MTKRTKGVRKNRRSNSLPTKVVEDIQTSSHLMVNNLHMASNRRMASSSHLTGNRNMVSSTLKVFSRGMAVSLAARPQDIALSLRTLDIHPQASSNSMVDSLSILLSKAILPSNSRVLMDNPLSRRSILNRATKGSLRIRVGLLLLRTRHRINSILRSVKLVNIAELEFLIRF